MRTRESALQNKELERFRLSSHTGNALAVAGVIAAMALPVGLFPRTSFPRIKISLNAGDRPTDKMLPLVSRPVAEAIHSVPRLQRVRFVTSRDSAEVTADFGWEQDMIQTMLDVDAAVAQVLPSLPAGTGYAVRRFTGHSERSPQGRSGGCRCERGDSIGQHTSPAASWHVPESNREIGVRMMMPPGLRTRKE